MSPLKNMGCLNAIKIINFLELHASLKFKTIFFKKNSMYCNIGINCNFLVFWEE